MNPAVREQLRQLVMTHGTGSLDDSARWLGLLRDLGVEHRREVFALATAYQAHAPQELLNSPRAVPIGTVVTQLTARLCADTGLADEAARWAIESWASALGLLDEGSGIRDQGAVAGGQLAATPPEPPVAAIPPATVPPIVSAPPVAAVPEATATSAAAAPPPLATPVELGPAEHRQIEQWLREAHVQRVRGQWTGAMALVRRVLDLNPNEAAALEMLGDLHAEHGDMEDALAVYRQAVGNGTPSAALEEKIARAVVLQEETERARLLEQFALQPSDSPVDLKRRRSIIMLIASLVMFALVILMGAVFLGGLANETNGRRRRRSQ